MSMSTEVVFDPETGEISESGSNASEFTVSELSQALKRTIEDRFGYVRVRGEISGFRGPHSSGHCYFSIKDETAKIDAVIWRGTFNRLKAKMKEGLEVVASGKLTSYPGKSSYQIVVDNVEPAGVGALMALLEERRKQFTAEGLFDLSRKRPLPYLPETIGVVTSPTGAVIRDILHRLNDRFPRRVIVWPVRVQGETAAAEVAAAISGFNNMDQKPDLIIVARGGGSLEDLWPFNEESVVRAAAASVIPLISAVGHETDTTLIDFVSDWRAPTPTAAAERAVPVRADLVVELASLDARLKRSTQRLMQERALRIQSLARALPKPDDILAFVRQRLDAITARLPAALRSNLQRHAMVLAKNTGRLSLRPIRNRLADHVRRTGELHARMFRAEHALFKRKTDKFGAELKLFASLNYRAVLARGYAVVYGPDSKPVRAAAQVKPGSRLEIEFSDGRVQAVLERDSKQGSLF